MNRKLRVLIGCECSGVVRRAFRELGHDAWSCDVEPADDNSPFHLQCDVREVLGQEWDLGIFHPPCTYLTNAGVRHFAIDPTRGNRVIRAGRFFRTLLNAPIPAVCVENPIPHKYAIEEIRVSYSQLIHPYMFGHMETKATCLWLRGLPKLKETVNVYSNMMTLPRSVRHRIHWMSPSGNRAKERSKTFEGIGGAMADQWSRYLLGLYD